MSRNIVRSLLWQTGSAVHAPRLMASSVICMDWQTSCLPWAMRARTLRLEHRALLPSVRKISSCSVRPVRTTYVRREGHVDVGVPLEIWRVVQPIINHKILYPRAW